MYVLGHKADNNRIKKKYGRGERVGTLAAALPNITEEMLSNIFDPFFEKECFKCTMAALIFYICGEKL